MREDPLLVPFTNLAARHAEVAEAVETQVIEVLRSGTYIGGPTVASLEQRVAARLGRAHGVGVASGTDALVLALMALGIGPGDEVIVPDVTFFATASAVLQVGARPVLVDVLPSAPLLDPKAAAEAVGPAVRAIIPVDLFGAAAPSQSVELPVVLDAAQSLGDRHCSQGTLCTTSFYPTKILGGAGDGGMVATDDTELARAIRLLANHGSLERDHHITVAGHIGRNSRLDAIQAAVVLGHLQTLDRRLARRRALARTYQSHLGDRAAACDVDGAISIFVIRHGDRNMLRERLSRSGIETQIYYSRPLSQQPALKGRCRIPEPTRQAHGFCQEALALPCHEGMTDAQLQVVLDALEACW